MLHQTKTALRLTLAIQILSLLFSGASRASPGDGLQEGDLIFHMSRSNQSAALAEITSSPWTHMGILFREGGKWIVYEAAAKVSSTSLSKFISRGNGARYIVKRVKPSALSLTQGNLLKLKQSLARYRGLPYDVYFEWSDDRIYCSELIWKPFFNEFSLAVGDVERFGDLPLDGPEARRLIFERYTSEGRELNLNEPVITPISMLCSTQLDLVETTESSSQLSSYCP